MIGAIDHIPEITHDQWLIGRAAKMRELADFLGRVKNRGSRRSPVYCIERPDLPPFPTCQAAAEWVGVKHSQQIVVAIRRGIAVRHLHFEYVGRRPRITRKEQRRKVTRTLKGESHTWPSIADAARETGLSWAQVKFAVKSKRPRVDGSRWAFTDTPKPKENSHD